VPRRQANVSNAARPFERTPNGCAIKIKGINGKRAGRLLGLPLPPPPRRPTTGTCGLVLAVVGAHIVDEPWLPDTRWRKRRWGYYLNITSTCPKALSQKRRDVTRTRARANSQFAHTEPRVDAAMGELSPTVIVILAKFRD
jgi:hypothetical protein